MPPIRSQSGILAKLAGRLDGAFQAAKAKEVQFSQFAELPGGIANGVALLSSAKFGTYKTGPNQGQVFFMADGVVLEPIQHNGVQCRKLRTKFGPEPLCNTKKQDQTVVTAEQHLEVVVNELKKLGVDFSGIDTLAEMEQLCEALVTPENPIYFRFSTRTSKPMPARPGEQPREPRVFHEWLGVIQDYVPSEEEGMEDGTVTEAPAPAARPAAPAQRNGHAPSPVQPAKPQGRPARTPAAPAPEPEPAPTEAGADFDEFADLDSLAAAAEAGDGAVQQRLFDMAVTAGYTEAEVADPALSWEQIVEMIRNPASANGAESAPATPAVGDVWKFQATGRGGKPVGEPADAEILAVDESKQTADVKTVVGGKITKNVPWTALS